MWTTMALAAALSLGQGQASQLTLTNVRNTYGFLGPVRTDNKYLPGDSYFVQFDIEGVQVAADGKVIYRMGMEVTDAKGKKLYGEDPRDLETYNTLGGSRVPAFANVDVGVDQPPGELTLKVTVTDRATKATQTLTRKFEVAPKNFGLVRPQLTNGQIPAPPLGVEGQEYWVHFAAISFERDKAKKPNLSFELRVLDASGKPTFASGGTIDVTDMPKGAPADSVAIPMQFILKLNRSGRYTVQLNAVDQISKKTAKYAFPLTVLDQKETK